MSEEKSSPIGTIIVVAVAAGLIGYLAGKPSTSTTANNQADNENRKTSSQTEDTYKVAPASEKPSVPTIKKPATKPGESIWEWTSPNGVTVHGPSLGYDGHLYAYINNWKDIEIDERDKIINNSLKSNTPPSTQEVDEYIAKMKM